MLSNIKFAVQPIYNFCMAMSISQLKRSTLLVIRDQLTLVNLSHRFSYNSQALLMITIQYVLEGVAREWHVSITVFVTSEVVSIFLVIFNVIPVFFVACFFVKIFIESISLI